MAYWRLFYHVTWATPDHEAIIKTVWQNEVYRVITDKSKELEALVYAIDGTESQIHLVASIPPKISLSTFIGEVKGTSSHFINNRFFHQPQFRWQPKFGIVSFSDEKLDMVVKYVENNHLITNRIRFLETCYVRQGEWIRPFSRLYYHFVWTTRDREPIIDPEWEGLLYDAIRTKCKELGGEVYALGGIQDHVHLAASVPPKIALSTFIGDVKGFSSCFVNDNLSLPYDFYWQTKYGVTSFGVKMLDNVIKYVNNQKQHHKEETLIPLWEQID